MPGFIYQRIRRFLQWRQRRQGLFGATNIETFGYCNRKCDFCLNNDRFPKRDVGVMDEALWIKIVDDLAALRFAGRISPHYYGEPLLDKRLPRLLAYARKRCPYAAIRLNSNGDLLTESLLLELFRNGLDRIIVTNYDEAENAAVQTLAGRYPGRVTYRHYKDITLANRAGALFDAPPPSPDVPCLRPGERLVINWKGNVVLCCNDYYEAHAFGNVGNESLLDIWHKPAFLAMRRRLAQPGGRRSLALCRACDQ